MRDIYDATPAPVSVNLPPTEPIHLTGIDISFLAASCTIVLMASILMWFVDATVSLCLAMGGLLVVFESWHTAVTFLNRHQHEDRKTRVLIHLAAWIPWIMILGSGALAMLGLFWISDHWFS